MVLFVQYNEKVFIYQRVKYIFTFCPVKLIKVSTELPETHPFAVEGILSLTAAGY